MYNVQNVTRVLCYLEDELISHSEGPVQLSCQVINLFLELLSI